MADTKAHAPHMPLLVGRGESAGDLGSRTTVTGAVAGVRGAPATWELALLVGLGLLAAVAVAVIAARSDVLASPVANGVLRGVAVGSWFLAGLATWRAKPASRLGPLFVAVALVLALTTLMALPEPDLFTAGRVAWACYIVLLAYVILAFPEGRLAERASRTVVAVAAAGTAILWTPLLFGGSQLPVGGALTHCQGGCPGNPVGVFELSSGAADVLSRLASSLISLTVIAAAVVLVHRIRSASRASSMTLAPPLAWMAGAALTFGVSGAVRTWARDDTPGVLAFSWIGTVAAVTFPYALLIGLLRGRLFSATALRETLSELARHRDAASVREVLARALRDPTLRVVYWVPAVASYVDAAGARVSVDEIAAGAAVTEVSSRGRPVAAIVHDPALDNAPGLMQAAGDAAVLALENASFEAELRVSIEELRISRTRIVAAAAQERRRLERELHDSAQNRLVGLQIRLRLARERAEASAPELASTLAALGAEAEAAIEELRRIAHGISPSLLATRGLVEALRGEAVHSGVPVRIEAGELGLSRPEVETGVYLCCLEAIQNAAKHAGRGASVTVRLRREGAELAFSVRDDGCGFDAGTFREGEGLTSMRDRVAAVGGRVRVASVPGVGVTVAGGVPWPPREA
jgi:signal transduction histidine kinase